MISRARDPVGRGQLPPTRDPADVIARFGNATELRLRKLVARAIINKAIRLGTLDRSKDAVAVYDDVLTRFDSATELPLREAVATALANKVLMLGVLRRSEEAIAVYGHLLARFGTATEDPLRDQVHRAQSYQRVLGYC